ncbi:transporter substrate-binding domain-containing protein [Brachyspira intermedia]|uniref:transporter substrate-binding domain-containing protein n=1 Tax=Brachyspira intermedia TaxID=84377 RepID=UPI003003C710
MKKIIIFILFALINVAACSNDSNTNDSENIVTDEALKVGIYIYDYPMPHSNSDNIGGFDYDLMNELAKISDLKIQFVTMQFDDLILALNKKRIDIIIAAMTITEDREKLVNFSDSYLTAGQNIVVNKGNTNITTTNDLVGKTVGVIKDTVSDMILSKMEGIRQVKRFEIAGSAFISLKVESIDAVLIDKLTGIYLNNYILSKLKLYFLFNIWGFAPYPTSFVATKKQKGYILA